MRAGGCGHPPLRGFQDVSGRRGRRPLRDYISITVRQIQIYLTVKLFPTKKEDSEESSFKLAG